MMSSNSQNIHSSANASEPTRNGGGNEAPQEEMTNIMPTHTTQQQTSSSAGEAIRSSSPIGPPPSKPNPNVSLTTTNNYGTTTTLGVPVAANYAADGHAAVATSQTMPQQHQVPPTFVVQGVPLYAADDLHPPTSSAAAGGGVGASQVYGAERGRPQTKFVVQGYKDIWAAVVFLGFTFLIFIIGAYNMSNYFDSDEFEGIIEGEGLDNGDGKENDDDDDDDDKKRMAEHRYVAAGAVFSPQQQVKGGGEGSDEVLPAATTTSAFIPLEGFNQEQIVKNGEEDATINEGKKIKKKKKESDPNLAGLKRFGRRCIIAGVLGAVAGIVLGIGSMGVFYFAPSISIVASNAVAIAILLLLGFYFFVLDVAFIGILLLILGVFRAYVLYKYRTQFPLSGLLLRQSTVLARRYPAATLFGFMTFLFAVAWALFAFAAAFPSYRELWIGKPSTTVNNGNDDDDNNHGIAFSSVGLVFIVMCFGIYWSSQVAFYLGHVVFSGVAATWYFFGDANMPHNPTLHSARRALTTSFGSVCLGSIFASLVRGLQSFLPVTTSASQERRFCSSICMCLTSFIRAAVEMFSHFSFTFVAMYGCGFVEGAKRSGQLVKNSPYQPIFNNLLLEGTLGTFQTVIGLAVGVITFYASVGVERAEAARERKNIMLSDPSLPQKDYDDAYRDFPELLAFIIAYIAGLAAIVALAQVFRFVDSTVTTLLVCLSEEPQTIFETNAEFGDQIASFAAVESRRVEENEQIQTARSPV